jgi:hypothetical protein
MLKTIYIALRLAAIIALIVVVVSLISHTYRDWYAPLLFGLTIMSVFLREKLN